ncbi:hypothetical protein ACQY0O_005768 [Thecaphora frezii]
MEYSPRVGYLAERSDHSTSRKTYEELGDAEYSANNSSQPSLTYSISTHADSVPSSNSRRDLNEYAQSDYASEMGQHTPLEDESDFESHDAVPATKTRVKFMTPAPMPRDHTNTLRPLGTKRRAQKTRPATAPLEPEYAKTLPEVPSEAPMTATVTVSEVPRVASPRRRACSNADAAAKGIENLMLQVDEFPAPPSMPPPGYGLPRQQAPLSVLDEFEWHGSQVAANERQQAQSYQSPFTDPLGSQHLAPRPARLGNGTNGTIRSKGSMATLMPRREPVDDDEHPFAFSPPSLSHEGSDGARSHAGSARNSFSNRGAPSLLSLSTNSSHSNDIEPRELLRRAKTTKIICGLDEELGQTEVNEQETSEVVDDLPPLLSTYYLAEQGLSKDQLDRLIRNPERLRAAQQAAMRAEMERKARENRGTRARAAKDEEEPISILAAEAKFLAEDPSKNSGKTGGKISSLLKKKSTSSNKIGNAMPMTVRTRPAGHQRPESRSDGTTAPYRDGNGGVYASPLGGRQTTSSVASSSSRDLGSAPGSTYGGSSGRSGGGDVQASETSLGSYGSETRNNGMSPASSSKGFSKLFGKKK